MPHERPIEEVTIILIEDDEGHSELIHENLREAGVINPIVHFDNGKVAVEALTSEGSELPSGYLIVLLDLNLPGYDGHQVLQRLRKCPHTHHIPIVILTTTSNQAEIDRCYEHGCNLYITKPIEYDQFQEVMRKLGIMVSLVKLPHVRQGNAACL